MSEDQEYTSVTYDEYVDAFSKTKTNPELLTWLDGLKKADNYEVKEFRWSPETYRFGEEP